MDGEGEGGAAAVRPMSVVRRRKKTIIDVKALRCMMIGCSSGVAADLGIAWQGDLRSALRFYTQTVLRDGFVSFRPDSKEGSVVVAPKKGGDD